MSYPYSNDTTSFDAAHANNEARLSQRQHIYNLIRDAGTYGRTDEELHDLTKYELNAVRPRRWQLVKDEIIKDSGITRPTHSGMAAIVWVVNERE